MSPMRGDVPIPRSSTLRFRLLKLIDMSSAVAVRPFRPEDLPAIARIFAAASMCLDDDEQFRHRWLGIVDRCLRSDLATIEETYVAPGGNFWVATVDEAGEDRVVGMVALLRKSEAEGEIKRVSVDVDYHRRGVGRRLMTHLESWARDNGVERLVLETGIKSNQSQTMGFYRSLGYELLPVSPPPMLFQDPPYFELATFVKRLNA